jgi:hypothetical protein
VPRRRSSLPVVGPSHSSLLLTVAATRSAPPPAPCRSHASLPGRPLPYPSPLPSSARATPTPSLPELHRGRHACRRSLTLPLARCVLFSNLKHVLSPHCILSFAPATTISPTFLSPDPAPHRTSAAPPGHRRQPPTPPLDPDPVLLEHHRDSLQLIDPPNSIFSHSSVVPHSTGELPVPPPLGLLSTRRHRAVPPPPKAPTALHQSVEAPRLLPHHPPASQLAERHAAIAAGKNPSRPTVDRHLLTRLRPNWARGKHPRTPAKLMRALSAHVRRPLAGNDDALPQPLPSLIAELAPPLLVEHITHHRDQ